MLKPRENMRLTSNNVCKEVAYLYGRLPYVVSWPRFSSAGSPEVTGAKNYHWVQEPVLTATPVKAHARKRSNRFTEPGEACMDLQENAPFL